MTQSASLEAIPQSMQVPVRGFAESLRKLGGENAKSLTLFGSVVSDTELSDRVSARSVLVLDTVDLDLLRRISDEGPRFGKQHIAAPLIMTPSYIKASCDTFPLELLDIQQNHIMVFGDDNFNDLSFDDSDIRHQCERELKVLAISLRQGLLAATGREKVITDVMQSAGDGLLRVIRGMLWLKGERTRLAGSKVVEEIARNFDCELLGTQLLLNKSGTLQPADFDRLYIDVEILGAIADAW